MSVASDIRGRASASEAFDAVATAAGGTAWFVGGGVRDLLLERSITDVDLAVEGDARSYARALHEKLGGDIFNLSDRFDTWRVLPENRGWQVDITSLRGPDIESDLSLRDFTVNAMALEVGGESGLIDPFHGAEDLQAGVLRVLGAQAYEDDPLRPLRLARFAAQIALTPDPDTAQLTREHAAAVDAVSPERIFAELRALLAADRPLVGLDLMDALGIMDAVLPELAALKGVDQSHYHHLDAYGHTLEVLERCTELVADPGAVYGDHGPALAELFAEPLADELTRGQALLWGALLHDIAKSETRTEFDNGRVGFPGHDKRGAEIVRTLLGRFNASEKLTQYVAALTRHHLRLGFLVDKRPLSRRDIYRYLTACEPVEVEVGVLSVGDRLATRGRKADIAIAKHLELAVELTEDALGWRANPLPKLLRGDDLAAAVGIEPGPRLGKLLAAIAEEQYAGEVTDRDGAIAFAKRLNESGELDQTG